MPKKFWQFRNQAADSAELLLYGDISDSSWWGDEVTPKTFADELNALGPLTSLTVRINSGGGDVFAAQTIGNLLEQHTAQVTARIDGLCASAATIIACHCDKVVAANDSTYMIHPVRMGIFDFADAVTLQQYIGALNTIRENILNLYTKKTGREKDEVAAWMDATSWWTGEEAMDLILVIVGVSLLVFTIVMIQLFKVYGTVPDTLITCVFATLGGECGIMGWIKTTKDRNRERKWEQEDKQEAKAEAAEVPPGDMPGA